jgi:LPS sulfotransferase NodH
MQINCIIILKINLLYLLKNNMKILIIAEKRSGSTNLALSMQENKNLKILFEPITNPNLPDFKYNIPIYRWNISHPFLLIKETFDGITDYKDIIPYVDKIIILHRENSYNQMLSYIYAEKNSKWHHKWYVEDVTDDDIDKYKKEFNEYKTKFKKLFLDNTNYFKITYEELYNKNKIKSLADYIGYDLTFKFPYGKKYSQTDKKKFTYI